MTSVCCASTASPSFCVQSSLSLIMLSTDGVAASDSTLSSHPCLSTAAFQRIALEILVVAGPASACTTSSG